MKWQLCAAAMAAVLCASPCAHAVRVTTGQGVTFQQLDFPRSTPPETYSRWGQIDVDLAALVAATGITNGWVNVASDSGWVVQNLPVSTDLTSTCGALQTCFDLGHSGPISQIIATVDYDSLPSASFPLSPLDPFAVTSEAMAVGGALGDSVAAAGAMPKPLRPGTIPFIPGGLIRACVQIPFHSNLETAVNQCTPMAAACNFDWLRAKYGIN